MPTLIPWAPHVWIHEAWVRFMGMKLQTRMTVVRLAAVDDGRGLWIHSPIGDLDVLGPALAREGVVRHIVAPNALHHLGLPQFARAFPAATTWATRNVAERSGFAGAEALERSPEFDTTPASWGPELELCVLGGNLLFDEALVLHKPSKTLIVTDFVEKIDESCCPPWAVRVLPLFGLRRGVPTPAPEHRSFAVDPRPLLAARQRVLDWDFERMIIAHGPNVQTGAKRELASCFDAAIDAAQGRGPVSIALRKLWLELVPS